MTAVTHRWPRQILAGDSIEFLVAIPGDYSGWTGSARLTGPSTMDATSCATEGTDFHVFFAGQGSSPATKILAAGQYTLTVWATSVDGLRRVTIGQFPLSVTADLSQGTPAQQHALVMLPIVEAAIQARLTGNADGGLEQYAIDGTSVTKLPMEELQRLRRIYSAEVAQIQNPNGQIRRIHFAFAPATGYGVGPLDVHHRFLEP